MFVTRVVFCCVLLVFVACGRNARIDGISLFGTSSVASSNSSIGTLVGNVTLTGECVNKSYSLEDDKDGYFAINDKGQIILTKDNPIPGDYELVIIGECDGEIAKTNLVIKVNEITEFTKFPASLIGTYETCVDFSTYSYLYTATLTEDSYILKGIGYFTTDCTGSTFSETLDTFSLIKLKKISENLYNLDAEILSKKVTFTSSSTVSYYNGTVECGFNDWTLNIAKEVTGRSCGYSLGDWDDTNGGVTPNIGTFYYTQIKTINSDIEFALHDSTSPEGLSEGDRVNVFPGNFYNKL